MNILNVSIQHSISTLAANGCSSRKIARELDLDRETVRRYRLAPDSKPAIVPTGSDGDLVSKPAISLTGSGRQSLCAPLQEVIEKAVEAGLSAQRIYQDLVGGHGFAGSYHSVQRFARQLRADVLRRPGEHIHVLVAVPAHEDASAQMDGLWSNPVRILLFQNRIVLAPSFSEMTGSTGVHTHSSSGLR